ncbi:MAG: hypothetical protein U1A78_41580 [Polyangia bacterium]
MTDLGGAQVPKKKRFAIIQGTDEDEVREQLKAALSGIPGVYERARQLTEVIRTAATPDSAAVRRAVNQPLLVPIAKSGLRTLLTRYCDFFEYKRRNGDLVLDEKGRPVLVPSHPKEWAMTALYELPTYPVPQLVSVVEAPVILATGRILQTPGHDERSGLFYSPAEGLRVPPVSDAPTADEVEVAKIYLDEVVCDFPFEEECHRSGWYAGVLSYFARWAYEGPTPLFLINKNSPGVGGSRLAEAAQFICIGRTGTLYTVASDNVQEKKALDAIALNGDLLVYIDNISESTPFGTGELDKALTCSAWDCNVKFKDGTYRVPFLCIFWGNGNQVQFRRGADTFRRTQLISLMTKLDKPQEREGFRHPDLLPWILERRGDLIWSFLTLLRAFFVAGKPHHKLKRWGSYEGWSSIVRECLVFHGYPDPYLASDKVVLEADPAQVAMGRLLEGWRELCEESGHPEGLSAYEAIDLLKDELEQRRLGKVKKHDDLIAAINEITRTRTALASPTDLGARLRGKKKRPFNGLMIVNEEAGRRGNIWRVVASADAP